MTSHKAERGAATGSIHYASLSLGVAVLGLANAEQLAKLQTIDQDALTPVDNLINQCQEEIESLSKFLDDVVPRESISRWKKANLVIESIRIENKCKQSVGILDVKLNRLQSYYSTCVASKVLTARVLDLTGQLEVEILAKLTSATLTRHSNHSVYRLSLASLFPNPVFYEIPSSIEVT